VNNREEEEEEGGKGGVEESGGISFYFIKGDLKECLGGLSQRDRDSFHAEYRFETQRDERGREWNLLLWLSLSSLFLF